ncbi:PAQR family membrane homeostasis protein TrhA [Skermanella pratensis]|uniref:PAQR family membrane homeostasis protein TrhA n=1 Tax=Skermanella pratensis TaxID=2233999 RepID=UPI001B3B5A90|nr:hemolysin III family protein [Skermanella pratensis]
MPANPADQLEPDQLEPDPLAADPLAADNEYTLLEEIANAVTHGIGAVLSVAALVALVALAAVKDDVRVLVSLTIYGSTLVLLYLASTLYHAVRHARAKLVFKTCDHAAIFLLIAGTYTPYCLLVMDGAWGWTLFAVMWSIAAFGVVFKILHTNRYARLSLMLYLCMGWLGVFAVGPIVANMATEGVLLLALGGLAYTGGVAFFLWESMPFNHAIWHLFVLAGSTCHFLSIYFYVAQGAVSA